MVTTFFLMVAFMLFMTWATPKERSSLDMVAEFHEVFEQPDLATPCLTNQAVNELRIALLREELRELEEAIEARDPVAVLDALTDLQYVLDGAYISLGFAPWKQAALEEVHRSNLSKLWDGEVRKFPNGKVMKSPSYRAPDLKKVLDE